MWKRFLLSYIIYCLWFLGVIVITVLCGIDFYFFLLSVVWLVAYEFHNSRSSLGWIFLSIQLLWGVALFIFIVSCGGSAQLIALVFNTANKSDWGIIFTCIATCLRIVMVSSSAEITIDQILHVGENIFNLHWWKNVTILIVALAASMWNSFHHLCFLVDETNGLIDINLHIDDLITWSIKAPNGAFGQAQLYLRSRNNTMKDYMSSSHSLYAITSEIW